MFTTSVTEARARLADLMDQVIEEREPVIITRRGHEPVALIAADELSSLIETVHLLRLCTNAERLLASLARARAGLATPVDLVTLQAELSRGDEKAATLL